MGEISAYRDGNVLRWLSAYTAAVTGDVVYFLALTWVATRAAGPLGAGLVIAVGAVPRAVLLLGGGVVVDRFGPRPVAIASDATRCAVILVAALVVSLGPARVWFLAAVALVFGVVDAVFMPAVGAFPPRLADASELVRVQGMRGLSIRLSNTVGPLLAGVVLAVGGTWTGFAAAGALFGASLVLLLAVRVRDTAPTATPGLRAGWRYLRRHRTLLPLVTVVGLSEMCFSGPVAAGLVLLADERGWGAAGMAWIAGAFSAGGAVASLVLTVRSAVPRAGFTIPAALLVTAATTAALGLAGGLPLAVGFGAATGLASGITMTLTSALVQTVVEPGYLGRVTAVTTLFTLGLAPVLFPAVGFVVQRWGAAAFFAGCGGVCLAAGGVALLAPRSL
jgi:MFS family permease